MDTGMNPFVNECILAEKNMNTLPHIEASSSGNTIAILKNMASCTTSNINPAMKHPIADRRTPLGKAYSCSDVQSPTINGKFSFITPRVFHDLITQNYNTHEHKSYPIIDCRSQMDYGCERIKSSYNVNCRAKIMARKLLSKRLEDVEPSLTISLNNSDIVILYDQSTNERSEDKIRLLPINLVIQAVIKSNKAAYIIEGGFEAVKAQYPHLIECSIDIIPREKHEQEQVPPTPEVAVDKENFTMTEIQSRLFVGNVHDAQNFDRLNTYGITHIINSTPDLPFFWENHYDYVRVPILDLPSESIRQHFDRIYKCIDETLRVKTNKVLVHCSAGISRSPTLVLAYMIKKNQMSLEEAFNQMRQKRQIVDPNISFMVQLRDWEKQNLTGTIQPATSEESSNHSCTPTRSNASGIYCGSSSKSKIDKNSLTESAIIVN